MTDETFISEKNPNRRFKFVITDGRNMPVPIGYLKEIIEPKLEENDWVLYTVSGTLHDRVEVRLITKSFLNAFQHLNINEIRKSSGEIWKKIDGEWVKI